jgi:hypothetical protein
MFTNSLDADAELFIQHDKYAVKILGVKIYRTLINKLSRNNVEVNQNSKLKRTHEHFKLNHLSKIAKKSLGIIEPLYQYTCECSEEDPLANSCIVTLWEETTSLLNDIVNFNYFGGASREDPGQIGLPFIPPDKYIRTTKGKLGDGRNVWYDIIEMMPNFITMFDRLAQDSRMTATCYNLLSFIVDLTAMALNFFDREINYCKYVQGKCKFFYK